MNKCVDCGEPVVAINPAQSEYVSGKTLRLPFTDICITVYHDKPTIEYGCVNCINEADSDRIRNVYDSGWNDGVDKVLGDQS